MDRPIGIGLTSRPFWQTPTVVRTEWKLSAVGGVLVALILLTFIGWLYLDQAAMIAGTETEIRMLRDQRAHLLREYRSVQWQLAESHSADQVMAHANALNLQASGQIDTLVVPLVTLPAAEPITGSSPVTETALSVNQDADGSLSWLMSLAFWLEAQVSSHTPTS